MLRPRLRAFIVALSLVLHYVSAKLSLTANNPFDSVTTDSSSSPPTSTGAAEAQVPDLDTAPRRSRTTVFDDIAIDVNLGIDEKLMFGARMATGAQSLARKSTQDLISDWMKFEEQKSKHIEQQRILQNADTAFKEVFFQVLRENEELNAELAVLNRAQKELMQKHRTMLTDAHIRLRTVESENLRLQEENARLKAMLSKSRGLALSTFNVSSFVDDIVEDRGIVDRGIVDDSASVDIWDRRNGSTTPEEAITFVNEDRTKPQEEDRTKPEEKRPEVKYIPYAMQSPERTAEIAALAARCERNGSGGVRTPTAAQTPVGVRTMRGNVTSRQINQGWELIHLS